MASVWLCNWNDVVYFLEGCRFEILTALGAVTVVMAALRDTRATGSREMPAADFFCSEALPVFAEGEFN